MVWRPPDLNMNTVRDRNIPATRQTLSSKYILEKSQKNNALSIRRKLDIPYRLLEIEMVEHDTTPSIGQECTAVVVDRDQDVPIRAERDDFYILSVLKRECERSIAMRDIKTLFFATFREKTHLTRSKTETRFPTGL
jgi:hypothetical protein